MSFLYLGAVVLLRRQHAEDTASFSLPAPSDDPLAAQDRPRQQLSALLAPGASGGKKSHGRFPLLLIPFNFPPQRKCIPFIITIKCRNSSKAGKGKRYTQRLL